MVREGSSSCGSQGKTRLAKWYLNASIKEKTRMIRDITSLKKRNQEANDSIVAETRYASLYFIACISKDENELITLEAIHLFVEVLDRYFGNVCELDIIFNFHKAYYILDELFIGGYQQESSKKEILRICTQQEDYMDESKEEGFARPRTGTASRLIQQVKKSESASEKSYDDKEESTV
ncbi:AP complex, mu/sigma subunit [Phytophthora cactorum]|nr:AP complex, mu/sigma subunit [Phytophthora cactorum]